MKRDWAAKKAKALWRKDLNTPQKEVARLLRAERRRAVRMCQHMKLPYDCEHPPDDYNQACNDCAKAIGGGK